jgi:hypothetical protein
LTDADVSHPQVEAYYWDWPLPPYHRLARGRAALLWASEQPTQTQTAQVFDRATPDAVPQFDPDHPRIDDDAELERLLTYLDVGHVLLATTERAVDILDPAQGLVVPLNYRTDGTWIWTDTMTYYMDVHRLAPDERLYAHIQAVAYEIPVVDTVAEYRTLSYLLNQPEPSADDESSSIAS